MGGRMARNARNGCALDGAAAPYADCPEWPEGLRLMRNARNARSGCALTGAAAPYADCPEWPEGLRLLRR